MKISCIFLLLLATGVFAPPTRRSKCRRAKPKLKMEFGANNIIDLTRDFNADTLYWPSMPSGFKLTNLFRGLLEGAANVFAQYNMFSQPEHFGTHMDSPNHFSEHGIAIHQVGFDHLIGQGVLINMMSHGERYGADSQVMVDDILEYESRREDGRIRSGSIVLFYTGYSDAAEDRLKFLGTNLTGPDSGAYMHFPGISGDAAEWLVENRCVAAVGIDTLSIDSAQNTAFDAHRVLTAAGVIIFENVGNLKELDDSGKDFKVIALPEKITNGTGSPTRIIAVLDD